MERVRENAGLAIGLGIFILLMGLIALASPVIAGLSVALVVGFLLIVSGIAQLVFAFKAGEGLWPWILGILTLLSGLYMSANVGVAAATLTIFLMAYLLASGISEVILALQVRPMSGWGWTLVSGALSIILGFMIWGQFPVSGVMAIGVFLGVKMLFTGLTLIMLGSSARKAVQDLG